MMQESRWTAEIAIMNKYFPQFAAFKTNNGNVGFSGLIRGPRTGREYAIIVNVPAQSYPEREPAVYIQPRIAPGYWQPNGSLSICHARSWAPSRNSFANCVLC